MIPARSRTGWWRARHFRVRVVLLLASVACERTATEPPCSPYLAVEVNPTSVAIAVGQDFVVGAGINYCRRGPAYFGAIAALSPDTSIARVSISDASPGSFRIRVEGVGPGVIDVTVSSLSFVDCAPATIRVTITAPP